MSSRCLAGCPTHSRELVEILIILRVAGYLSSSLFGVWLETESRAHWSFGDWRYLLLRVKYRLFPLILRELNATTITVVIFLSEKKWRWAGRVAELLWVLERKARKKTAGTLGSKWKKRTWNGHRPEVSKRKKNKKLNMKKGREWINYPWIILTMFLVL